MKLSTKSLWLFIVVGGYITVFLASRLVNLTHFPLFIDEVRHILRAQATLTGDFFIGMREAMKQLFIWLVAFTFSIVPNKIFAARLVSVLAGLAAAGVCYKLAMSLYPQRRLGYLAALFYLISPFALFFDRLALTDTLLAALLGGSVIVSLRLWRQPTSQSAIALGVVFGLAALTKPYAALYYPVPLLIGFVLRRDAGWAKIGPLLILTFGLAALAWIPILTVGLPAFEQDHVEKLMFDSPKGPFLETIFTNVELAGHWLIGYLTWPFVAMTLYVVIKIWVSRNKPGLLLVALIIFPLLVFIMALDVWFSRYLLPLIVPLSVLIAWGTADVGHRLSLWFRLPSTGYLGKLVEMALFVALCLPSLPFDYFIIVDPSQASLPTFDREDYIEGRFSGYGLQESAAIVEQFARDYPSVVVLRGSNLMDTVSSLDVISMMAHVSNADNISIRVIDQFDQNTIRDLNTYAQSSPTLTLQTIEEGSSGGALAFTNMPQAWVLASFSKPGHRTNVILYQWLLPHDLALRELAQNGEREPKLLWLPQEKTIVTAPGDLIDIAQIQFDSLETLSKAMNSLRVHYILVTPEVVERYPAAFSPFMTVDGERLIIQQMPSRWRLVTAQADNQCSWCLFDVETAADF
ncbi:MAG: glycosyltransferase family 39 protein [Anaerolineae bacterium]|nr:glycosyltransferase family 39 protein [Anaerolineae bacterium]